MNSDRRKAGESNRKKSILFNYLCIFKVKGNKKFAALIAIIKTAISMIPSKKSAKTGIPIILLIKT
jgi:hypothetical protein